MIENNLTKVPISFIRVYRLSKEDPDGLGEEYKNSIMFKSLPQKRLTLQSIFGPKRLPLLRSAGKGKVFQAESAMIRKWSGTIQQE